MANRGLGTLTVDIVAKIGGFVAGMSQAERTSKQRLDAIEKHAKRVGAAIGAAILAGATAAGYALKQAINNADALDEMAERTGIAVETLSRLQVAAAFGAVEMEDLQKAVGRLAVQQQNVAEGNEDSIALFKALGVEALDAEGKLRDTESVLADLADVFASMPDGPQKVALAMDLLGKSGQNLIPFLNQGGERLEELNRIADDLGLTLSGDTAKAAGEFNDQMFLIGKAVDGVAAGVAADLLPDLVLLTKEFASLIREGGGVAEVAHDIADGIRGIVNIAQAAELALAGMGERLSIVMSLGRSIADPENWRQYAQEIERSKVRIEGLAQASERVARETRELFGIDPVTPQSGGSSGSPNGRGRGVRVHIREQTGDLDAYNKRREAAAAAAKAQSEADRAAAEAARELERADAELARRLEELTRLHDDYVTSLDDLEASLAGPLAEAELAHKRQIAETQDLLDQGAITVEEATRAQMLYAESFAKTKDELDPYGEAYRELLSDMQFELDLLGQTNAARITSLELRRLGIDMATEEGEAAAAAIRAQVEALELEQDRIDALDDFRASFEDNVAAVLDGSKSIKDAIGDMVDDFIAQLARLAAQSFTESLFGEPGTSGGGKFGDLFGNFFSMFGGGKAAGGPVMAGVPYLVGERGPELVIPSASGTVIPAGKTAAMLGRGGDMNVTILGSTSRQSLDRLAVMQSRRQRRAVGEFA